MKYEFILKSSLISTRSDCWPRAFMESSAVKSDLAEQPPGIQGLAHLPHSMGPMQRQLQGRPSTHSSHLCMGSRRVDAAQPWSFVERANSHESSLASCSILRQCNSSFTLMCLSAIYIILVVAIASLSLQACLGPRLLPVILHPWPWQDHRVLCIAGPREEEEEDSLTPEGYDLRRD